MLSTEGFHPGTVPHPATSSGKGISILLVDDDSTVLAIVSEVLRRAGYSVFAATSPLTALETASRNTFDMLITDFQMPGMDGFELASQLTRTRTTLPVLIVSGSYLGENLMVKIAERHWNFVPKPIGTERLLQIVGGECLKSKLQMSA